MFWRLCLWTLGSWLIVSSAAAADVPASVPTAPAGSAAAITQFTDARLQALWEERALVTAPVIAERESSHFCTKVRRQLTPIT